MPWQALSQAQAPEPLLPEQSATSWVMPLVLALLLLACCVAVAVYVVRTRRLAAQALQAYEHTESL